MTLLDRDELLEALTELAVRLSAADVTGAIRVVGGAALSIEHFDRGATADVDALFSPADEIRVVAETMARERGWPLRWLNNDVKMYATDYPERARWTPIVRGASRWA